MAEYQSGILNKIEQGKGEPIDDVNNASLEVLSLNKIEELAAVAHLPLVVCVDVDVDTTQGTVDDSSIRPDLDTEDWMSKLKENEIFNSAKGPAPRLHGLRRLAKPYILSEESKVNALIVVPRETTRILSTCNGGGDVMSESEVIGMHNFPMASVTFNITLQDGRTFSDSADAYYSNCDALGLFPTAVASARAEARCLRKVLGIREHAAEEMVDKDPGEELAPNDDSSIKPEQTKLIEKMLKSLEMSLKDLLEGITTREIFSVEELTTSEARKALRLLNDYKKKNSKKKRGSKK